MTPRTEVSIVRVLHDATLPALHLSNEDADDDTNEKRGVSFRQLCVFILVERGRYPDRDIVLMLDDDIDVPAETAKAVADKARELGRACSAVYATLTAKVAAARWAEHPGLWLVGLGCVAIPARCTSATSSSVRGPSLATSSEQSRVGLRWCSQ